MSKETSKYKVGNVVTVKSIDRLYLSGDYRSEGGDRIIYPTVGNGAPFNLEMEEYCGLKLTIRRVDHSHSHGVMYILDSVDKIWRFSEWMLTDNIVNDKVFSVLRG